MVFEDIKKIVGMNGKTTLRSIAAGLPEWASLTIFLDEGAEISNPDGARPRLANLRIQGSCNPAAPSKIICGDAAFYVGYKLPDGSRTVVNLESVSVVGIDRYNKDGTLDESQPRSKPGDLFISCHNDECENVRWGNTYNGPVGFGCVIACSLGPFQCDVFGGDCDSMQTRVFGVRATHGSHPDIFQVTRPDWKEEHDLAVSDLTAVDLDCQFMHLSQMGPGGSMGLQFHRVYCESRKAGQVWASRVGVPIHQLEWVDVHFGQPLHWRTPDLRNAVFVRCNFPAGIYPRDVDCAAALSRATWIDCTFAGGWTPNA